MIVLGVAEKENMSNRRIEFRVWDDELNKFIYFPDDSMHILIDSHELTIKVDNRDKRFSTVKVQESTGCHDKLGRNIYEGDVIAYHGLVGEVEFFSGAFRCMWRDQTDDCVGEMIINDMEIVGVKHE